MRPADVLLPTFDSTGPLAIDFTVVHPLRTSQPLADAGKVVAAAEQAKTAKYASLCNAAGLTFEPLGLSTWCGYGPRGLALINRVTKTLCSDSQGEAAVVKRSAIIQKIAFALMQQVAQQLLVLSPGSQSLRLPPGLPGLIPPQPSAKLLFASAVSA